jgi:hypothetical protein
MFNIGISESSLINYWQYRYDTDENFDRESAFEKSIYFLKNRSTESKP